MIEKPPDIEPPKPVADGKSNGNGSRNVILEVQPGVELPRGARPRRPLGLVIIGVISVSAILAIVPNWIQKWLWMRQVGYSSVFWTLFAVRWELFGAAFVFALLYLWINLRFAAKNGSTFRVSSLTGESVFATKLGIQLSPTVMNLAMGAGAAVVALFYAGIFYAKWNTYLRFRYGGSFGLSDPLFGADAGFYVFRLPFYELLQSSLTTLAVVTLLAVLAFYAYFASLGFSRGRPVEGWSAKATPHLSVLFFVLAASWGWGFYLDHFQLLLPHPRSRLRSRLHRGSCDADRLLDHAGRRGGLCALLVFSVFRPRLRAIVIATGIYVGLFIVAVWVVPALFQRFTVQPNELARETPYLKNTTQARHRDFRGQGSDGAYTR
jgi:uncharacterized membrane protein (UPF0182 family)